MLNRKKGNPNQLKIINEQRKEKTLKLIRSAVEDIKSSGYEVTIQNIMEYTSLSRGTFSLNHIIELLKELKIGKYGKVRIDKELDEINIEDFIKLEKELSKKEKQIEKQKISLKSLTKKNTELLEENNILRMNIYEIQLKKDIFD